MAPRASKTFPRGAHLFPLRDARTPAGCSFKLGSWGKSSLAPCLTRWGGDPRALWRFADQRGGPIYKLCRSRALFIQTFPDCAQTFPNTSKNQQKSAQDPPKIPPKSTKILPKSTQDRSRTPLGAHLRPMFYKSSISKAPKTAKKRPRAPKRGPRLPQTPPKWSPRPSQNRF